MDSFSRDITWALASIEAELLHVDIVTLDNPGWAITIDLSQYLPELKDQIFVTYDNSDFDWLMCRINNTRFEGRGGLVNFQGIVAEFNKFFSHLDITKLTSPLKDIDSTALKWAIEWYHSECDGDWEHSYGVHFKTTDRPGWKIVIELNETVLENREFSPISWRNSEKDWLDCSYTGYSFESECSILNLIQALEIFKGWAQPILATSQENYPIGILPAIVSIPPL